MDSLHTSSNRAVGQGAFSYHLRSLPTDDWQKGADDARVAHDRTPGQPPNHPAHPDESRQLPGSWQLDTFKANNWLIVCGSDGLGLVIEDGKHVTGFENQIHPVIVGPIDLFRLHLL